jgi:hypothetical protein
VGASAPGFAAALVDFAQRTHFDRVHFFGLFRSTA